MVQVRTTEPTLRHDGRDPSQTQLLATRTIGCGFCWFLTIINPLGCSPGAARTPTGSDAFFEKIALPPPRHTASKNPQKVSSSIRSPNAFALSLLVSAVSYPHLPRRQRQNQGRETLVDPSSSLLLPQ